MKVQLRYKGKANLWRVFRLTKTTTESWMEPIKELCTGYYHKDILNMNGVDVF